MRNADIGLTNPFRVSRPRGAYPRAIPTEKSSSCPRLRHLDVSSAITVRMATAILTARVAGSGLGIQDQSPLHHSRMTGRAYAPPCLWRCNSHHVHPVLSATSREALGTRVRGAVQ